MSNKLLTILSFLIFSFISTFVIAQDDDKENTKNSNSIKEKTNFKVVNSRKNEFILGNVTPEERVFSPIKIVANHATQDFKIEYADFEPTELTLKKLFVPLIKNNPNAEFHRGYVKIGFGNYLSPFAAASISNKKNSKYLLNLGFKHNSSFEGPVDKENSANSSTNINLDTKYFLKDATLSSKLSYKHDIAHFYGYSPDLANSINAKDIAQNFNTLGLNIKYQNNDFDADIQYQAQLNTYYFTSKYGAKEFEINPELATKYKLNSHNTYIGLKFGTSIVSYQDITNTNENSIDSKRYLAWISPLFEKKINNLDFKLGANVTYNNDSLYADKQIFFYPNVSINYALMEGKTVIYTSLKGATEKNMLRDLVQENPYAQAQLAIFHQDKQWAATLGIKSKLGKKGYANLSFSKSKYKHSPFWINDVQDRSRFNLIYEDVDKSTLNLEFTWEHESFKALFSSTLNQYTMQSSEFAWHLPTLVNTLSLNYKLQNKNLLFNLDAQHLSGIHAKDFSDQSIHILNDIIDINIGVNYQFPSSRWGAFVQVNNILSQTYQRYLYYDSKQINVIGGLSYSFN
jgi:hypothetical protein